MVINTNMILTYRYNSKMVEYKRAMDRTTDTTIFGLLSDARDKLRLECIKVLNAAYSVAKKQKPDTICNTKHYGVDCAVELVEGKCTCFL